MLPSPVVVYCFVFTGGGGVTTVIDLSLSTDLLGFFQSEPSTRGVFADQMIHPSQKVPNLK